VSDQIQSQPGRAARSDKTPRILYTLQELSRRLNVPHERAAAALKSGKIRADFRTTNQWLFLPERMTELQSVLQANRALRALTD